MMKKMMCFAIAVILMLMTASCSSKKDFALFDKVMPGEKAFEEAKNSDAVVFNGAVNVAGREIWDSFCADVENGKPSKVLSAAYYDLTPEELEHMVPIPSEEEKASYPQTFFTLLEYDGKKFSYSTRMSSEEELDSEGEFAYMLHFTGDLPEQSLYDHYEYYVLVNDPDVTWEDIEFGTYSSISDNYIPCKMVFSNLYN